MTREEVVQLFNEAGEKVGWKPGVGNDLVINYLTAFASLVAVAKQKRIEELEQKNLRLLSISAENYNKLTGWMDASLKAEAERDKLLPDANRYRWLRQQHWNGSPLCVVYNPAEAVKLGHTCPSMGLLDAAIDERMKEDELKDI